MIPSTSKIKETLLALLVVEAFSNFAKIRKTVKKEFYIYDKTGHFLVGYDVDYL